ncbi:MAG TPA: hypothetical protein VJX74_08975 [Blastocatellia bacterium]|nr:hypothetical protein [Blastocatellia bacterium]
MEHEREVRLRRQIEELVRSRVGALEQDISRLQREVNESFTSLLERTDAAATMPESDESLAQIAAEVNAQVDAAGAESVRLGADIALLRDSVAELDQQRTQAEVLNALIARAANFAPRVVLFVVKGANALAWAARGMDEESGAPSIRGMSVSLQSDTVLRAALNSQQTFYGSPDQQAENQLISGRLGNIRPQRVLAVPLKVRGKSAAVVYADSADHGEEATNVEAIELLVHTTGLVVELVSLRARMAEGAQVASKPAPAPARPAAPSPAAPTPAAQPYVSAALPMPSAPLPQAQPEPPANVQPQPASSVETHESPAPAPTYFRPAAEPPQPSQPQATEAEASAPPAQASEDTWRTTSGGGLSAVPVESPAPRGAALEEEEQLHNNARRFARLLVSEIKLYNEQKVSEGRRNNDLYDRLKEDIDRSRQMYEKRVVPSVAAKFDYFYDELVNTLAEGDPGKLGSDHPGPSVAV